MSLSDKALKIKQRMLLKRRERMFQQLQILYDLSTNFSEGPNIVAEFKVRLQRIDEVRKEFSTIQDDYNEIELGLNPEAEPSYQASDTFDELYYKIQAIAQQLLPSSSQSGLQASGVQGHEDRMVQPRLPRIDLPKFDGLSLDSWPHFYDTFVSLVHSNSSISAVEKFHYLVSCLSGPPLSLAHSLPITHLNYPIVFKLLTDKYQNKRILATHYLDKMFTFQPLTKQNLPNLGSFIEVFFESMSALKALRLDNLSEFILFYCAVRNLDTETRKSFETKHTSFEIPTFDQLVEFVQEQIKIIEVSQPNPAAHAVHSKLPSAKFENTNSKPFSKGSFVSSNAAKMSDASHAGANSIKCPVCKLQHRIYTCESFLALDVPARIKRTQLLNLCKNCLRGSHLTRECPMQSKCSHCRQRHNSLLHLTDNHVMVSSNDDPELEDVIEPEYDKSDAAREDSDGDVNVTCHSSTCQGSNLSPVLLGTAILNMKNAAGGITKRHSGKLAALKDAARAPSLAKRATRSVSTLTEVCSNEEVPEVEIVSLLQEQIPRYRLRADTLTQFGGYENQDWFIPSPALQAGPEDLALSPDQIRETLNYFLLCSNRVSQMTKTYNDIEAVTRLLEEKEKDLELTARIGKELLTANGRLEARVGALEGELRAARDTLTQLKHELASKSDLLQVLTNDTEECLWEEEGGGDAAASAEVLLRRTGALERENRALREEASRLAAGTDDAEDAERALLLDIANQLASANAEANSMGTELAGERERATQLHHQLQSTAARLAAAERSHAQLTAEHEHTVRILEITRENQNALASELADAKERYAEVMAHLVEAQEQLRAARRRGEAAARGGGLMPSVAAAAGLLPGSLHQELHSSIYSDLSLDSGISDPTHMWSVKKVFETVQCASQRSAGSISSCGSEGADLPDGLTPPPRPRATLPVLPLRTDDSLIDDGSDTDSDDQYPGGTGGSGVPGAPGAAELAAALRRLTPADISGRRAALHAAHATRYSYAESEGSAVWGVGGAGRWRLPNKLQIVKPIEGSHTLHTWAQLAKPNMSGLLEEHEGVGVRGGRSAAALGLELYRLSDVEEDDDLPRLPYSSHVYTLTDSMVMHPNDGSMAGSVTGSAMSSAPTSVLGSAWSSRRSSRLSSAAVSPTHTPRLLSRRDSFATPAPPRARWSPTATPANSPLLNSPESSPPSTPHPGAAPPSLHALISCGASILRRDLGSERSPLTLQTPGSLYTGLVHRSPMEQLTCLKRTLQSPAGARGAERREEPLGVPGAPGSGALEAAATGAGRARAGRTARVPRPRTDLGTVGAASQPTPAPAAPHSSPHSSPLGTLSSLLFGRKGGLL